jgi:hypothetical protein
VAVEPVADGIHALVEFEAGDGTVVRHFAREEFLDDGHRAGDCSGYYGGSGGGRWWGELGEHRQQLVN